MENAAFPLQERAMRKNSIQITIEVRDILFTESLKSIYLRKSILYFETYTGRSKIIFIHSNCRKGYNGTACVMKTLCEVGEKRHEHEPGSFLAEIVRAIFR